MMFPQTLYTVSGIFRYALIIFVTKIYIFKTSIKSVNRNNWILLITFNYYLVSVFQANKHKSFMTKRFVTVWTFVIQSWSLQLKLVCLEIIFLFYYNIVDYYVLLFAKRKEQILPRLSLRWKALNFNCLLTKNKAQWD